MPFTFTCADHPDVDMHYVEDILAHQRTGCRTKPVQHFQTQIEAQGNTQILIGGCRRCGNIGTLTDIGLCSGCVVPKGYGADPEALEESRRQAAAGGRGRA